MVYTEIKERNGKKYYYRVKSIRDGKKFKKKRIYLGKDLSKKEFISKKKKADNKLNLERKLIKLKSMEKIIPKIRRILKKNQIKKAGIFGSYARGEQKKKSDIDILVKYPKGLGFGFAGIQIELEEKLGKKVHLVTYGALHPLLKERILNEEVRII